MLWLNEAVIDVPNGLKGFLLVQRLHDHHAYNKQAQDGRWHVHVELTDPEAIPGLLTAIQPWLRAEQVAGTTVHVGDEDYELAAPTVG